MENSFARIAWLEDVIRAELPHVNLGGAPNLIIRQPEITSSNGDTESAKQLYNLAEHTPNSSISDILYDNVPTPKENSFAQAAQNVGAKQPAAITHGPSSRESSVEQDTRSVALDLGLLSLNSDSRQLHYVGSSSGSLFASLVQAGSSRSRLQTTTSPYEVDSSIGQAVDSDSSLSSTGPGNGNISRVYELLRNVSTLYIRIIALLILPCRTCHLVTTVTLYVGSFSCSYNPTIHFSIVHHSTKWLMLYTSVQA